MISQKPERMFDNDQAPRNRDSRVSYDERQDHILEAATRLIARVGYDRATMRGVAKEAGVSLAGIYHYFDSKERILFVVQFRSFTSLLNNLREKLVGVDEPVEQLRIMVRSHVGYFAANMAALKVCSHELDTLSGPLYEETRRIRRDYYDLTRLIIKGVLEKHAPNGDLDLYVATMSLFGMLNWLYRWYRPDTGRSPNNIANQLACQFLRGLTGAAEGKATAGRTDDGDRSLR